MAEESTKSWSELGEIPIDRLTETRLQLHWAAQPVMAFADCALERRPDDSQANLGWRGDLMALVSRPRPEGYAAGLSLIDLDLLILDGDESVIDRLPLEGRTIDGAVSWLERRSAANTGAMPGRPIVIRDYEMPEHGVAKGEPFRIADREPLIEFAGWLSAGWTALDELATRDAGWAEVRCWPHHFDLGTLRTIGSSSIGAGLSPGDSWYPEPYFYVNPYGLEQPPSEPPKLESHGSWHTDGWFGAVLTASTVVGHPADSRETAVSSFLSSAVDAAAKLVGDAGQGA